MPYEPYDTATWLVWRAGLVVPADTPLGLVADRKFQRATLLAIQGGRCATCPALGSEVVLCVDHEHETGRTRGLLCRSCNGREGGNGGAVFDLYRANPPAASLNWSWDWPAPPQPSDEEVAAWARRRVWQMPEPAPTTSKRRKATT